MNENFGMKVLRKDDVRNGGPSALGSQICAAFLDIDLDLEVKNSQIPIPLLQARHNSKLA